MPRIILTCALVKTRLVSELWTIPNMLVPLCGRLGPARKGQSTFHQPEWALRLAFISTRLKSTKHLSLFFRLGGCLVRGLRTERGIGHRQRQWLATWPRHYFLAFWNIAMYGRSFALYGKRIKDCDCVWRCQIYFPFPAGPETKPAPAHNRQLLQFYDPTTATLWFWPTSTVWTWAPTFASPATGSPLPSASASSSGYTVSILF